MRILITGASGQLGNELRRLLESGFGEIGKIPNIYQEADVLYTDAEQLDISNCYAVKELFDKEHFDLVINCAAFTNVDGCEANQELAYTVNKTGASNLAIASAASDATIVHVSTDYVFSGTENGEREEGDTCLPLSVYGKSKYEGENAVVAANPKHHIIRTAWLYGYVGKNFPKTMLKLAESHSQITVVDDQFGNPTNANDLAYEILKIALTKNYGIWHVTNEGTCSWAEFAEAILDDTDCKVIRCTSEEYQTAHPKSASRPAFSSLRNKRLEDTIGNEMRPWKDALASYLSNLPNL